VQKSTPAPRSVANLSQSTVEKVISGDPSALAVLASYPSETISTSSDTSSKPPSTASSTSTTPKIDALKGTPQSLASTDLIDFGHNSEVWQTGWRNLYNGQPALNPPPLKSQPDAEPEQASCCCSKPAETPSTPTFPAQKPDQIPEHLILQQSPHRGPFPSQHTQYQPMPQYSMHYGHQQGYEFPNSDFQSFELAPGCGGMHPVPSTIPQRMMSGDGSDCRCGDNCACFACMTHPNNRTTIDYVRYHNDLLSRPSSSMPEVYGSPQIAQSQRPTYSMPFQYAAQGHVPHGPPQFSPHHGHGFGGPIPMVPQTISWQHQTHATVPVPHTPVAELDSLHFTTQGDVLSPTLPGPSLPMFSEHTSPSSKQMLQQSSMTSTFDSPTGILAPQYDADSPLDEDASTLSPSSFLLQHFTVPGCDDITGTCQCGEGCECPGCLTHSGHGFAEPQPDSKERSGATDDLDDFLSQPLKTEKKSCCS
jgi:hypothetical protein